MSWLTRGAAGIGVMAIGIAAFAFGLLQLLETGTCASGGPYVSARPCPDGTGWYMAAVAGGIVVFLAGAAVFATRGRRATAPGLPPDESPAANPQPFSRYHRQT